MNPIRHIRTRVFRMTQITFASAIGIGQPALSRIEQDLRRLDYPKMQRIRTAAKRRRLEWNDSWFFEVPA